MEGGRDGDGGRDRDPKKKINYYLLQRSDICQTLPPSENVTRQHPMKSGGGPAPFSIMSPVFGGSHWLALVVVLIFLTFEIDLKKWKLLLSTFFFSTFKGAFLDL